MEHFKDNCVEGYYVLGMHLRKDSGVFHHVLMKPHVVRKYTPAKPSGRTLMFLNVPPFVDEERMRHMLSDCGTIEQVHIQKSSTVNAPSNSKFPYILPDKRVWGFKVVYVVFKKETSIEASLKKLPGTILYADIKGKSYGGLKKYIQDYKKNIVARTEYRKEAAAIMADYDLRKAQEKEEIKAANKEDDEGWTTVRHKVQKKRGKKNKQRVVDFYGFQEKEVKLDHLEKNLQKYHEDKRKADAMRAARKFRPA